MFLFKTLGIIFFTILMILLINQVNFYYKLPKKYRSANWTGHWSSVNVLFVGGKIVAALPDPLPINEEFEVDAMIYYNVWSIYKMGGVKNFVLIGKLGDDNAGDGENIVDEQSEPQPNKTISFKAKIQDSSGQIINYTGISDKNKKVIIGGYKSIGPPDMGSFVLKRK